MSNTKASEPGTIRVDCAPGCQVALELSAPTERILVPGSANTGRAEVVFGEQRWAAKHYWRQGKPGEEGTIYEFDGPIPAGRVVLVLPADGGSQEQRPARR